MSSTVKKIIEIPLNRVEGDLEIRVEMEDGRVTDAWSAGIMYRGIENMLKGRAARDGLVITPRICGICGTAHLFAAVKALEDLANIQPPPNATLVRNLALMTEHIQSDVRHGILMFMADFANPAYKSSPLYDEALARYEPFQGLSVIKAINATKQILEVVALFGGQWPHSSYMVPGGVSSTPSAGDISQCQHLVHNFTKWYEQRILGCSIERWQAVENTTDLDNWLAESTSHRDSDLGFYIRFSRAAGLAAYGTGFDNLISFGQLEIPAGSNVRGLNGASDYLMPAGFAKGTDAGPFDQAQVTEHVAHSWYVDYDGGKHPFKGMTRPFASGGEGRKYSWAKAPRYTGLPAETGPLAELVITGNPLFVDLLGNGSPSIFSRQLARLVRPTVMLPVMRQWLAELDATAPFYTPGTNIPDGRGIGLGEASRGAIGHWIEVADGKIIRYQIITPTAWNGSPRDSEGVRGPWEEALIGVTVKDMNNPVELGHVIRSFDACLVCTVHGIKGSNQLFRTKV